MGLIAARNEHAIDFHGSRHLRIVQRVADEQGEGSLISEDFRQLNPLLDFAPGVNVVEPLNGFEVVMNAKVFEDVGQAFVVIGGQYILLAFLRKEGLQQFFSPVLEGAFIASGVILLHKLRARLLEGFGLKRETRLPIILEQGKGEDFLVARFTQLRQPPFAQGIVHDIETEPGIVQQGAVPVPDDMSVVTHAVSMLTCWNAIDSSNSGRHIRGTMKLFLIAPLFVVCFLFISPRVLGDELPGASGPIEYWRPIMDEPQETFWDTRLGFVFPSKTSSTLWDDVSIIELSAWGSLMYWETTFGADFDIRGKWDSFILQGFDGTSSGYPLTAARISMQYSQRFENNYGLRLRAEPGLYTAFEGLGGEDFGVPFGILGTYDANEAVGGIFGINIYPGFDQVVDPEMGIRYVPNEAFSLHAGYPETRLKFRPYEDAGLDIGMRFMLWPEFQMDENDARERIMYDESRLFGEFSWTRDRLSRWYVQLGYAFNREIDFEKAEGPIDVDDGFYIQFGLGGLL